MKCEKCKVREANTHIKKVVNGEYTELMLCSECAHALGYDNVFDFEMPDMFGGLLQSFFTGALPARSGASRCPECGSTYGDITNTGKVGCAHCYEAFFEELLPSIRRIHGNTLHCGKVPHDFVEKADKPAENEIDNLKTQLQAAIDEQNFELAAELRDKIKAKETEK
ncbi:MAG: UvrB/UvrC motif-containing protein [Clostridia bacterium]|nr:UvrB/UvrC motif-containing protein [Clostridia bacterium]